MNPTHCRPPAPDAPGVALYAGDAAAVLAALPAGSARVCVTSPPYYALRSYLPDDSPDKSLELGQESDPPTYVARLVEAFRGVRRVLADDGTLWLNLGDSYAMSGGGYDPGQPANKARLEGKWTGKFHAAGGDQLASRKVRTRMPPGYKCKDLLGIPWKVAEALREDGWYLRLDVIWAKGVSGQKDVRDAVYRACLGRGVTADVARQIADDVDPYVGCGMPEQVRDRPSRSHEYVFILSKSARYFYDHAAVAEPSVTNPAETRNRRSVWTIPTRASGVKHYATYPPALVETCLRAGSGPGDTVLDPFCGVGSTGLAAAALGRHFVGVDLDPRSLALAAARLGLTAAGDK